MNPTGPAPIPTALKIVKGTQRADRGAKNEAKPPAAIPQAPAHLDEEAKAEWTRMARDLFKLGLLTKVDRSALAQYCIAWSLSVKATNELNTRSLVVLAKSGNEVPNPFFKVLTQAQQIMYRFLTEFGMTPASRSRIEATPPPEPKPKSRWDGFRGK